VVGLFAFFVLAHLVVVGINRAIVDVIDGAPVSGPFVRWNLRTTLPTALALGAILTVGTLVLVLPGLILAFFTRYAIAFAADGASAFAAIVASFKLVATRPGSELGFAFRSVVVLLLGIAVLGIGLYVAIPVVLAAQVVRYRQATSARAVGVQPEHRTG
jgi:uncharacterized membrane protein